MVFINVYAIFIKVVRMIQEFGLVSFFFKFRPRQSLDHGKRHLTIPWTRCHQHQYLCICFSKYSYRYGQFLLTDYRNWIMIKIMSVWFAWTSQLGIRFCGFLWLGLGKGFGLHGINRIPNSKLKSTSHNLKLSFILSPILMRKINVIMSQWRNLLQNNINDIVQTDLFS